MPTTTEKKTKKEVFFKAQLISCEPEQSSCFLGGKKRKIQNYSCIINHFSLIQITISKISQLILYFPYFPIYISYNTLKFTVCTVTVFLEMNYVIV